MTFSETSFIKSIYGSYDRFDYLVINTGNVIVVDFNYPPEKRQAIIDDGYRQTMDYFTHYLPLKKQKLYDIYFKILDELRRVQGFFILKKFVAAKNCLSELFIYLAKVNKIVDQDVYNPICLFQKLVFANVKAGLLGRSSCANLDAVTSALSTLIADITARIDELEEYIEKFSD